MPPKKAKQKTKLSTREDNAEKPIKNAEKIGSSVKENNGERKSGTQYEKRKVVSFASKSIGSQDERHSDVFSANSSSVAASDMSLHEDIITLVVPETSQKIVHCHIGHDLFVDKTWCMVKKEDILEDVAIQDSNSPFFSISHKIQLYPVNELLIGYEPFSPVPNQFMLCITEEGRDEVLEKLENLKKMYTQRIQQSKEIVPKKWQSLGSESFVDQFQMKEGRKKFSLEWIGDLSKRCVNEPNFEDCDPDSTNNGYTSLVPSSKEKFDLVFKKTQEIGIQAVAQKTEASAQTEPEIPTNACTQYAPETEITVPPCDNAQAAITSHDLNTFFEKYLNYLVESLRYNEVYDLYHDDYPALVESAEETQVQSFGTYHQYQSFTDVAAVEGKLVISSSWHPNYSGIVAIAYANEIPSLMKELEYDSDQADYEDEKTDSEEDVESEVELGVGAREWLENEKKEIENTTENTEAFDKAMKKLKDIEASMVIWDAKIQESTDGTRKPEVILSDEAHDIFKYREYKEPEPEVEEVEEEKSTSLIADSEVQEAGEDQVEGSGQIRTGETASAKTIRMSDREQLEADVLEQLNGDASLSIQLSAEPSFQESLQDLQEDSSVLDFSGDLSKLQRSHSGISRKKVHHRKKHRKNVPWDQRSLMDQDRESTSTLKSSVLTSTRSLSALGKQDSTHERIAYEQEYFEEITDEEEVKEKQDELPLLELNNPVLVWSFVDDLTPKLRLDSPYEVRVVSFSKHNGNLIAGGTASGQVVVWDITGRIEELEKPESLTPDQQNFRKRMEDLMRWRRDIQSKRRVRISAISSQAHSHLDRVTNLFWISPTVMVTDTVNIVKNPDFKDSSNLQFVTISLEGEVKVWDLNSQPIDKKKQGELCKTKDRFGRPSSLDTGISWLKGLYRRWKPHLQFVITYKNDPVHLTCLQAHAVPVRYERLTPRLPGHREVLEDRVEYRAVFQEINKIPTLMYLSNLFGRAGTISWEAMDNKLFDGEIMPQTVILWDLYHDGPITQMCKHPFIPTVCLTVGGHVFSIWHTGNYEEPIFTRRYYGVRITDGTWSSLRPSLIRIARSDGVLEIWDLIIQSHAPVTTINVSGNIITNISPPLLPEARGLLGVADYNSAFRLFFIPQQFRVWTEDELERLKSFINREPERKAKMKKWSMWWRENNVNLEREEKMKYKMQMQSGEEERTKKDLEEEARKVHNKEVYLWYMRRRGNPFLWHEEAEKKWKMKQEEHMLEMVMAKKKIDRSEMERLMKPIIREEKIEAQKHAKAQERIKQADMIFRQTVQQIFPKSVQVPTEVTVEEQIIDECSKLIEYYYGDNFEKLADEQEDIVKRSPWQFDFEWYELLEKYNALRMLFNDRRRKRSKTLRWLRKKLCEELMKEGRKVHIRKSHMERYQGRKIERRMKNLDYLKKTYGEDYNIHWDKDHPCRRFVDKKFRHPIEETESHVLGALSEPDEEDEEWPQMLSEGKVQSSLELMTEVGVEHIPVEVFATDLDATLITMESRSSLGIKTIPSLKFDDPLYKSATSAKLEEKAISVSSQLIIPKGYESPKNDSDFSIIAESIEDKFTTAETNELQELDYIQHKVTAVTGSTKRKDVVSIHKKESTEKIQVKEPETFEESGVKDEIPDGQIHDPEMSEEKYQPEDSDLEDVSEETENEIS